MFVYVKCVEVWSLTIINLVSIALYAYIIVKLFILIILVNSWTYTLSCYKIKKLMTVSHLHTLYRYMCIIHDILFVM